MEIDGTPISDIDEGEVERECKKIREMGLKVIVVVGVFSPADPDSEDGRGQEDIVGKWIKKYYRSAQVVLSKHGTYLFPLTDHLTHLHQSSRESRLPLPRKRINPKRLSPLLITKNDILIQKHLILPNS